MPPPPPHPQDDHSQLNPESADFPTNLCDPKANPFFSQLSVGKCKSWCYPLWIISVLHGPAK